MNTPTDSLYPQNTQYSTKTLKNKIFSNYDKILYNQQLWFKINTAKIRVFFSWLFQ